MNENKIGKIYQDGFVDIFKRYSNLKATNFQI